MCGPDARIETPISNRSNHASGKPGALSNETGDFTNYNSTPKMNVYSTPCSSSDHMMPEFRTSDHITDYGTSSNIYSTPCNDNEATYQSLTQSALQKSYQGDQADEGYSNYRAGSSDRHHLVSASHKKDAYKAPGLAPSVVSDCLAYLSPNKFDMTPLDKSSYFRAPSNPVSGSSWLDVTQLLCGLMSLVMNIETFLFFPLFLLEWRGDGLLVYLILLALVGLPIFMMETLVGSLESRNCLQVWSNFVPLMSGLGSAISTATLFWAAKVCVLLCYSLVYSGSSLLSPAPWNSCEDWWGPDKRCVPTIHNHTHHYNNSLVCTLFDLAGQDCHPHTQPSHQQFWNNFVLQSDPRGLRVLGELGALNLQLILVAAAVWAVVGGLVVLFNKRILRLASVSVMLLLILTFVVVVRNMVQHNVLNSFKIIFSLTEKSGLLEAECWTEALFLLVSGLTLFSGSIRTYSSHSGLKRSFKLVVLTTLLMHLFFLVLSALTVLPLVPENLDPREQRLGKELGYFPLAELPIKLSESQEGTYFVLIVYAAISLSGFNLMVGLVASFSSMFTNSINRTGLVWFGLAVSVVGFLLTLPLLYESGPSMLVLYARFGFQLPVLVLGTLLSVSVFWFYGYKRIISRAKGGKVFTYLFSFLWALNPLLLLILVVNLFVSLPGVPEPSPLPAWAINLGIFFTFSSIIQVVAGSLVSGFSLMIGGQSAQLLGRAGHRTSEEEREMSKIETFSYKCYFDLHK